MAIMRLISIVSVVLIALLSAKMIISELRKPVSSSSGDPQLDDLRRLLEKVRLNEGGAPSLEAFRALAQTKNITGQIGDANNPQEEDDYLYDRSLENVFASPLKKAMMELM